MKRSVQFRDLHRFTALWKPLLLQFSNCILHLLQSFVKRQVRDTAEEVPPDYAPPDFTTAALQHTNVKLTWDADDDTRKKALRKKMTEDSIRDDDFKVSFAAEHPVASASTVLYDDNKTLCSS